MSGTATDPASLPPHPAEQDSRLLYGEICRSHAGIADFRAKLLALLPIASGAGIFLLLDDKVKTLNGNPSLVAAGLFGFVVTFGLFMYELRGIEDCVMLRGRAEFIEEARLQVKQRADGHYFDREDGHLKGLVSEIGAGWVVYVSVMAAWLYVAGVGWDAAGNIGHKWAWLIAGPALGVIALGVTWWNPDREKIEPPDGRRASADPGAQAEPETVVGDGGAGGEEEQDAGAGARTSSITPP